METKPMTVHKNQYWSSYLLMHQAEPEAVALFFH